MVLWVGGFGCFVYFLRERIEYLYLGPGRPRGLWCFEFETVSIGSTAVLMILSKNVGRWAREYSCACEEVGATNGSRECEKVSTNWKE